MRQFVFVFFLSCFCMAEMNLILLKEAAIKSGAVCLDGGPAGYYFKKATSTKSANKWVLHFHGGGWCYDEYECLYRAQTGLGSTSKMESTYTIGGPLDEDENNNPDFYDWNHVTFAYCDGASFAGELADPLIVEGKPIYFRGFRILKAAIADLIQNRGMKTATDVFLTGESAGGLSVYLHADQIRDMLPSSVKRYKAAAFSGIFLDHGNAEGKMVFTDQLKKVYTMQNCSGSVDLHCLLSKSPRYMWMCMFGQYSMAHMESPLFVSNSNYDRIATQCIIGAEPIVTHPAVYGNCSAVPGWATCENDGKCTKEQWDIISEWGNTFNDIVSTDSKMTSKGNGLFEYSCHKHSSEMRYEGWNTVVVQGTLMRDAIGKWYFSDDEDASKHTYRDCKNNGNYCCNPTCCV